MTIASKGPLADGIEMYLAHKRSLGKQLDKVGPMLYLLDGYLLAQGVGELRQIVPTHIGGFVASRPRRSPRSYNGLIGALRGLFDWMVVHELLSESPLRCELRRVAQARPPFLFNPDQARSLFEAAAQLPNTLRALNRGEPYKMIFALPGVLIVADQLHPVAPGRSRGPAAMVVAAAGWSRRSAVSRVPRWAFERGCRAAVCLPARQGCPARMPLIGGQASDPTHAAPRCSHDLAPLRCRPQRHRTLAGT